MRKLLTLLVLLLCTFNLCAYAGDVYTVSFDGADAQSTASYFTFGTGKHNFNAKYTGSYGGVSYTKGLKMEGTTLIAFTSTATSTVTIVQSLSANDTKNVAFDGSQLDVSDRVDNTTDKVGVYTITDVAAGEHSITRGSGETGVLFVQVEYTGAEMTTLSAPSITFDANTGEVTIAQAESADVYYTIDGTVPAEDNGTKYAEAFTVEDGTVVKAVAIGDGETTINSPVAEQTVLLSTVTIAEPVVKGFNGSFAITCATPNTTISYSLDGGDYTTYTRSFTITKDAWLKVKVSRDGCETVESDDMILKAPSANAKTKTIFMGYGSFTTSNDGKTLVGKEGDDAYGYTLVAADGKTLTKANKIKCDLGERTAIKASNGSTTTLQLPEGVKATKITFYSYVNYEITKNTGWQNVNGTDYTQQVDDVPMGSYQDTSNPDVRMFFLDNAEGSITFANTGLQLCFTIALDIVEGENIVVSDAGLASYCSSKALDFSEVADVEAYVATSYKGNVVSMTKVAQVPAGTGIIVKSVSGGSAFVNVPCAESAAAIETNLLVGVTEEPTTVVASTIGSYNYIFSNGIDGVGFYRLSADHVLAPGKAYLHTTEDLVGASEAKGVVLSFGGETTGITSIQSADAVNGAYYTISGVRVANPTKGLYIKDGKKVIIK